MHLNEIVNSVCERFNFGFDIEFYLSPNLIRDYSRNHKQFLYVGMYHLLKEISLYRLGKLKIKTSLNTTGDEVLEFFSCGESLSEEKINILNRVYKGEYIDRNTKSGSNYAGEHIRAVNGLLTIENCNDNDYTVKNKIVLKQSD